HHRPPGRLHQRRGPAVQRLDHHRTHPLHRRHRPNRLTTTPPSHPHHRHAPAAVTSHGHRRNTPPRSPPNRTPPASAGHTTDARHQAPNPAQTPEVIDAHAPEAGSTRSSLV